MRVRVVVSIASILLVTTAWAQEPPGWVPLSDLPYAQKVMDVVEVPGTSILVAAGYGYHQYYYEYYKIWRSTNAGASWDTCLQHHDEYKDTVLQLTRDSVSGRIWGVASRSGANTLYYSTNDGGTWTGVSGPSSNPAVRGNAIQALGDYVYFGGTIGSPYSISLYRLHQTNLTWEIAAAYPECDAITQLKFHAGKLFVFCRDMDEAKVRVFTYAPGELDSRAIYVGKAETSTPSSGR